MSECEIGVRESVIANSPAAGQALLASTNRWLQWEDLKAKVSKCHAMCLKSCSSVDLVDHHRRSTTSVYCKQYHQIPRPGLSKFPYNISTKSEQKSLLQSKLTAVDEVPPTHQETETKTLQLRNLSLVELLRAQSLLMMLAGASPSYYLYQPSVCFLPSWPMHPL